MKAFRPVVLSSLVLALACVFTAAPASAAESCHKINAKGIGQDLGGGRTTANISGGGLLNGTTVGNFSVTALSGTVATIEGTVKFTANKSTLTVAVNGTFDTASGDFNASGPVAASTGKLAGATGNLDLTGKENLADGSFVETVTGSVCADLNS